MADPPPGSLRCIEAPSGLGPSDTWGWVRKNGQIKGVPSQVNRGSSSEYPSGLELEATGGPGPELEASGGPELEGPGRGLWEGRDWSWGPQEGAGIHDAAGAGEAEAAGANTPRQEPVGQRPRAKLEPLGA